MMHLNIISSGQGAPSTYLIKLAGDGIFPCDAVIVADTGWENKLRYSTGKYVTNKEYFEQVTKPLSESNGLAAYFVRSRLGDGSERPPIPDYQLRQPQNGKNAEIFDIPLFGSQGGKSKQSCTELWKIRAVRQQMRRMGANTGTVYLGLTMDEVHRVKPSSVKWISHDWPLVMPKYGIQMTRIQIQKELKQLDIPYLKSTQCDGCPHKGLNRWRDTPPETIKELEDFERCFSGEWFLTRHLVPLSEAIKIMEENEAAKKNGALFDLDDSCDSGYCFI
jgi:hypothetical protein